MKSYLLSTLKLRYSTKDVAKFEADHPYAWLLWEPGAWNPPRRQTLAIAAGDQIRQAAGESLALALEPKDTLTLGRDETCDLTINDGTLSSTHLVLHRDAGGGWTVEDLGSRNGTLVGGRPLQKGERTPLRDGMSVVPAQVVLTFHTPAGLFLRLKRP